MKKRLVAAMAAMTAVTMFSTTCLADGNDKFLTMIPNHDNEVGTYAAGPNGEAAVPAVDVQLTEEQYAKAKEMGLSLAMLWAGAGEWYNGMSEGAKSECEKMGIEVVTTADAEFDPALQATQIETALALNPDIMLTLPVDPTSGTAAYRPAVDAGVKIVFADNSVNDYVGGEEYVAVCTGDQYGM